MTDPDHDRIAAIGALIRQHRVGRGLSQTALARRLGVAMQRLNGWERGRNRAPAELLLAIAELLDIPYDALRRAATTAARPAPPDPIDRARSRIAATITGLDLADLLVVQATASALAIRALPRSADRGAVPDPQGKE